MGVWEARFPIQKFGARHHSPDKVAFAVQYTYAHVYDFYVDLSLKQGSHTSRKVLEFARMRTRRYSHPHTSSFCDSFLQW